METSHERIATEHVIANVSRGLQPHLPPGRGAACRLSKCQCPQARPERFSSSGAEPAPEKLGLKDYGYLSTITRPIPTLTKIQRSHGNRIRRPYASTTQLVPKRRKRIRRQRSQWVVPYRRPGRAAARTAWSWSSKRCAKKRPRPAFISCPAGGSARQELPGGPVFKRRDELAGVRPRVPTRSVPV